jgi:hypothetical protein
MTLYSPKELFLVVVKPKIAIILSDWPIAPAGATN